MTQMVLFGYGFLTSPGALLVLALVAFLMFGNRLPSVMRSLGRSVTEFKKGVAGIEDDLEDAVRGSETKNKTKSDDTSEV